MGENKDKPGLGGDGDLETDGRSTSTSKVNGAFGRLLRWAGFIKPPALGATPPISGPATEAAEKVAEVMKPRFPRNTVAREASEVPRQRDVCVLGDLNGSAAALMLNLQCAGYIEDSANMDDFSTINWIGGDSVVVAIGDIVADKGTTGHRAMAILRRLEPQIKAAGGDLVTIRGNHEKFASSFLTNTTPPGAESLLTCFIGNQDKVAGIAEFFRFSSFDYVREAKDFADLVINLPSGGEDALRLVVEDILKNMQKDEEGKLLLLQMRDEQIAECIDDTLIFHTDPTPEMLDQFLQEGVSVGDAVDRMNQVSSAGLNAQLLGVGQVPKDFDSLEKMFLRSGNRSSLDEKGPYDGLEERFAKLRKRGINRIIHGHSPGKPGTNVYVAKCGLVVVNSDLGLGRDKQYKDRRSVVHIAKKGGTITSGTDVTAQRVQSTAI